MPNYITSRKVKDIVVAIFTLNTVIRSGKAIVKYKYSPCCEVKGVIAQTNKYK